MNTAVMRNIKTAVCLSVLFSAALSNLYAQNPAVFDHPLSAETLPRYTALCAELSSHPVIKGSFEQTKTIRRLNRSLVSRGEFLIAAEHGMVWITSAPFPSTMAVGRDFIIQSVPGGSKTKLDAGGNETFLSLADTISAIFTGNVQRLREQFDNYFTESRTADGTVWTLGLAPRESAVRLFAERIILSGGAGGKSAAIRSITIYERGGDSVSYTLWDHRFPAALEADEQAYFSL
ncbi:hypothetical protein AGMMS50293_21970 [Spirochaetia bacterium]|nr:hypothetical protein AGMMS50293_21970 [Spirochaetia bacterium]